jgi:hypothetical protein
MEGPCPSGTTDDAAPDGPPRELTIAELGQAQLDGLCAYFERCGTFESVLACRVALAGNLSGSFVNIEAAVAMGKSLYHPDRGTACAHRFDTLACDRGLAFTPQTMGLECALTFTGSGVDGQACGLDEECVSNICVRPACAEACCPGTCKGSAAPQLKSLLESCTIRDICVDSFCTPTGVCEPLKTDGTNCQRSEECMPGSGCVLAGTNPTCQPRVATDGSCSVTEQCLNLGDVCSGGLCKTGGLSTYPCSNADGCQFYHQCQPATGCDLPPDVGESCSNFPTCQTGYCGFGQMCVDKLPDGSTCDSSFGDAQCQSNYCDKSTPNFVCGPRPICT